MRRKEERSKQRQANNKAKQHSTPKAVTFPKKNELPRVGLCRQMHSTCCSSGSADSKCAMECFHSIPGCPGMGPGQGEGLGGWGVGEGGGG